MVMALGRRKKEWGRIMLPYTVVEKMGAVKNKNNKLFWTEINQVCVLDNSHCLPSTVLWWALAFYYRGDSDCNLNKHNIVVS